MLNKFNPKKLRCLSIVDNILKIFYNTPKCKSKINWNNVKNILVLDPTALGDIVMLIPFLKVLRLNAPKARITLVSGTWGKDILSDQGLVDEFITFGGYKSLRSPLSFIKNYSELHNTIKQINEVCYDVSIEPRGDIRYIFFMSFVKAQRKISYNYTKGESMLTDVIIPSENIEHLIDDKLFLLNEIGCQINKEDCIPKLKLSFKDKEYVNKFKTEHNIKNKKIIGIHPGASCENKMWPYYDELLLELYNKNSNTLFLIFEGPNEEKPVKKILNLIDRYNCNYIIIKENIKNYIRILSICDEVYCNDSGAGHISAALGIPVTVIFGAVSPKLAGPRGENIIRLISNYENQDKSEVSNSEYALECLKNIKVEDVLY